MSKRHPNVDGYEILQDFVVELRRFVRNQLAAKHGDTWMKKTVPEKIREEWIDRQRECEESRWVRISAESPLDFSYENELKDVILRENNWRDVFKKFLGPDKKNFDVRLTEVVSIRNHIVHFRPITKELLSRVSSFTHEIRRGIAVTGAMAAGDPTAQSVLPSRVMSGEREPTALEAPGRRTAHSAERAEPALMKPEQRAALERLRLRIELEAGAFPDESEVEPTRFHLFFDDWNEALDTEVLAWQTYAPRTPVPRGSKVSLAIRYNPAAANAPGAKRAGVGSWKRAVKCFVRGPRKAQATQIGAQTLDPQGWVHLDYVPRARGKHEVLWGGGKGGAPRTKPWVRDDFVVE
jgi:hypothetical protein